MKLRVIWSGRTRNPNLAALADDYVARVRRFLPLDLVELKEPRTADDRRRVEEEGRRILDRVESTDYLVALDEAGRTRTSGDLVGLIERHMRDGGGDLAFVVGGPAGLSEAVRTRANLRLSLSRFTYSHDLARAVILEQIYRAMTIIRNLPYAR
jgi:23S rRNA (pseudouridine1915-N3)-methyltransferase